MFINSAKYERRLPIMVRYGNALTCVQSIREVSQYGYRYSLGYGLFQIKLTIITSYSKSCIHNCIQINSQRTFPTACVTLHLYYSAGFLYARNVNSPIVWNGM